MLIPLIVYALLAHGLSAPASVPIEQWRLFAIFAATLSGISANSAPPAAVVLVGLVAAMVFNRLSIGDATSGFRSPSIWFVVAACALSQALRETGLARRFSLFLVQAFGGTSRGLALALTLTDIFLAPFIPSITARSGGVVSALAAELSVLHGSEPGGTERRLGTFLMLTTYQTSAVVCAMFLTGQASNPLLANMARNAGVTMTWSRWALIGLIPGLISISTTLFLVHRLAPPEITKTPEARAYARREREALGRLRPAERITSIVAGITCLLWVTASAHHIPDVWVALSAVVALVACRVLSLGRLLKNKTLWEMTFWYAGLCSLAQAFAHGDIPNWLVHCSAGLMSQLTTVAFWAIVIGLFFFAHYFFASITTLVLALYAPVLTTLIAAGTSPELAAYSLAFAANLSMGLTHYGTTSGPMIFAYGYVSRARWWGVGLVNGLLNLVLWLSVGGLWWYIRG
jgi:DASS family divalent anion:Na+ symporter